MKKLITLVYILSALAATAQQEARNWYFGHSAGISFSTNPPTYLAGGQIYSDEGCSSISDANGNLLFYSDGVTVWDRNNSVMPNGSGLFGGSSSTQSCVVVPLPGSSTMYFLFTPPQQSSVNTAFYYSMVDMTLNNGFGDVINKNNSLFAQSAEKITSVRHRNGMDYWVIGHPFNSDQFYTYLITSSGINATPIISTAGTFVGGNIANMIGYMKSSPCGNKLANAIYGDDILEILDFNDSTGEVSNPLVLATWTGQHSSGVYGIEFSPDNSKLYASIITPASVVQFDLLAGSSSAIIASATTVGTSPLNFNGALQNGPDGRMYLTKYGAMSLACITNPNLTFPACNYVESFVSLASSTGTLGLPNFISSFFCGLNVNTINHDKDNNQILISPNPASGMLQINLGESKRGNNLQLKIINSLGETVYHETISTLSNAKSITVPLQNFQKGIYLLSIVSNNKTETKKILVE